MNPTTLGSDMRVAPMLASPSTSQGGRAPIAIETLGQGWYFQRKYDGVRAQLTFDGHRVSITGRNGNDLRARFPEIVTDVLTLDPSHPFSLDGEIVLLDPARTLADLLSRVKQTNTHIARKLAVDMPAQFVAFDILHDGERWLMPYPLDVRLQDLAHLMNEDLRSSPLGYLAMAETVLDGPALLEQTRRLGQEGVVAKLNTGTYVPGRRSYTWVKFKNTFTIFAIAYAPSGDAQQGVSLAVIDDKGQARPVGSVGAGLDAMDRANLEGHWHHSAFPVVLIECLGISAGGRLRQPVFKGIVNQPRETATTAQLAELPVST